MQPMRSRPSSERKPRLVAADGMLIVRDGVVPGAGGLSGKAALGQDGSRRCCKCYAPVPADRKRSPYCATCKAAATDAAARARDAKKADAAKTKEAVLAAEHWVGNGYVYGKDGTLILAPEFVRELRDEFGATLSLLAEFGPLTARDYDPAAAEHYQRVLGLVLEQVENLNLTLRHALWPKSSGLSAPGEDR